MPDPQTRSCESRTVVGNNTGQSAHDGHAEQESTVLGITQTSADAFILTHRSAIKDREQQRLGLPLRRQVGQVGRCAHGVHECALGRCCLGQLGHHRAMEGAAASWESLHCGLSQLVVLYLASVPSFAGAPADAQVRLTNLGHHGNTSDVCGPCASTQCVSGGHTRPALRDTYRGQR